MNTRRLKRASFLLFMATLFLEPGGDADFGFGLWASSVGSPTIVNDHVHGRHIKSIRGVPSGYNYVVSQDVLSDTGGRISLWIYIKTLPANTKPLFQIEQAGDGDSVAALYITSAGVLQLSTSNAFSQIGSSGSTLTTGVWYRLTLAWKITSTTVNELRLFKNGSLDITVTNATLSVVSTACLQMGNNNGSGDVRYSDIYIDNSNALTDPGNIWVTAKRPIANGSLNQFTTQIGSGGSIYGSGHTLQINERPQSDTNGWSIQNAAKKTEEYTIELINKGDIDLTGASVIDYMGWIRAKVGSASTGNIIVGGIASNISVGTSAAFFTKIAGSNIYPTGNTDIGMDTNTVNQLFSLYEAGIVVAYIPIASVTKLGVNYNASDDSTADRTYFNKINLNMIRVSIPTASDSSGKSTWRNIAKTFHDAGFYTIYGVTDSVSTATWSTYATNVINEATLCESSGICDEFQIGNELEFHNADIADVTLRDNIRALATSVKAVFSGVVSYATVRGLDGTDTDGSDQFIKEGIGDLDRITVNMYGWVQSTNGVYTSTDPRGYSQYTPQLVAAFGDKFYISEFNLDSDISKLNLVPEANRIIDLKAIYSYFQAQKVSIALAFLWSNTSGQGNDFAFKLQNGNTQLWNAYYPPAGSITSDSTETYDEKDGLRTNMDLLNANFSLYDLRKMFYAGDNKMVSQNDAIRAFLQSQLGNTTTQSLNDLWRLYFIFKGVTNQVSLSDMAKDFFTNIGF